MTAAPELPDLLLTGGTVLTLDDDRRVISPGAVAIRGDRIVAVGTPERLAGTQARRTVDCAGSVIMPGFVDCHSHLGQQVVKGLGEGTSVWEWLTTLIWPMTGVITSSEVIAVTRLAACEAVRAGITCVVDHQYFPPDPDTTVATRDAMEMVGLRGVVARGMTGSRSAAMDLRESGARPNHYSTADELAIMSELLAGWPSDGIVDLWPAPLNIAFADQAMIRGCVDLARQFGTKWHTHCCEAQSDPDFYATAYGTTPVAWLHEADLLGPETTLAHAIWLSDAEIELLAMARASISHNPVSNQYLASGILPLRRHLDRGVQVGLGTDGPAVGHRMDPFETMKAAVLLQRIGTADASTLRSEQALELGTRGGARLVGRDVGVLADGMLADVVVVDMTAPNCSPATRPVSSVVNSATPRDVRTVIINGKVVVDEGSCTLIDEHQITHEARRAVDAVLHRAGLAAPSQPWIAAPHAEER